MSKTKADALVASLGVLDDPLFPVGDLLWKHPDARGKELHAAMMGLVLVARDPKLRPKLEALIRQAAK